MSSRPFTSHSCIWALSPSLMDRLASGSWARNARVSGTVNTRARLGGSPMATRPDRPPRTVPKSSRARCTWCKMPRPCASSTWPASVGTAPRPLRTSRVWCRSTSSMRIRRERAGCVVLSICAARVKLPSSATRTKPSICLKSMGVCRVVCAIEKMAISYWHYPLYAWVAATDNAPRPHPCLPIAHHAVCTRHRRLERHFFHGHPCAAGRAGGRV